jgi:arylsulfatase A-like enzyme
MSRLVITLIIGVCFALPILAADPPRPNILVFLADDLGYGDVGYHGSSYKMPHIDRLAAEGVRLEQHYVHPMCSPTRAALMTGRYASRFGVTAATNDRCLPFNTVTLASALRSVGYDTAITGKWHLGSLPEWGPRRFGFNFSYGAMAGGTGPYDHRYKTGPYTANWHRNDQYITEEGHVTDLITRQAVQWLAQPRSVPFFLYVPFTAVHIPIKEPAQWVDMYRHIPDPVHRQYAACASHMDDAIGKIIAAIPADQRDNTLIAFFSDNGGTTAGNNDQQYPDAAAQYDGGRVPGNNAHLRDYKATVYDGGIHVAAILHWPARLRNADFQMPTHAVDFMPTFCHLAGFKPASDLKWDGVNLWPILTGEKQSEPRTVYTVSGGYSSAMIRHGDWKLVVHSKGKKAKEDKSAKSPETSPAAAPRLELYNLAADPGEKTDLSALHPDIVADLQSRLQQVASRDKDALPKDQPPSQP